MVSTTAKGSSNKARLIRVLAICSFIVLLGNLFRTRYSLSTIHDSSIRKDDLNLRLSSGHIFTDENRPDETNRLIDVIEDSRAQELGLQSHNDDDHPVDHLAEHNDDVHPANEKEGRRQQQLHPRNQHRSESTFPQQPPNNCTIVGDNVPRFRLYPLRFMKSDQMKEFKRIAHSRVRSSLSIRKSTWHGGKCEVFFIHIFKCGGSSIRELPNSSELRNVVAPLSEAYQIQQEQWQDSAATGAIAVVPKSVNVFAFLRDPIARFVSAISQIFDYGKTSINKCKSSNTTQQLYHCVLDKIVARKMRKVDLHLDPQLLFLYKATLSKNTHLDVAVDVLSLSDVSSVFHHLGVPPKHERAATGRVFGHFHLSTSELTPELIQRICEVYYMDVWLLHHVKEVLGIDTECFRILTILNQMPLSFVL